MLLQKQQLGDSEAPAVAADSTEDLRQILARQSKCDVSYEDAGEVGDALIEFYLALAEEADDESVS